MLWFSSSWMTWWGSSISSLMSWDGIDLSRMNPAASLPSPPSAPFLLNPLSSPSFSCRDTRWLAGKCGVSSPVVTLVFVFPCPACKPKACCKQLDTSVLASIPIPTVAEDLGNKGFGVAHNEPRPVRDLSPPSPSWVSSPPGPVLPLPCLAVVLKARVLWLPLSELSGSQPRSYFRQRCTVSLPRAYETLFWDSSPDSLFPLPPHAGKHRCADDFFGKLLRRREQE